MIIIIGAGPAGLSTAFHLKHDYLLLEQDNSIGGLCRSFDLAGVSFDLGGHAFFTKHEEIKNLLLKLSDNEVCTQPREAWIYSYGTFIPYPFQANLYGLPTEVVKECIMGLFETLEHRSDASIHNFQEWINQSFGSGISKHFLEPYNKKLWAYPLTEIFPEWTANRIVKPDIDAILDGALRRVDFKAYPNSTVLYPAQGGFINLFKGFLPYIGNRIKLDTKVKSINLQNRTILLNNGEVVNYEYLVSTMPLDQLVGHTIDIPSMYITMASKLKYNSLHIVSLVFDRAHITEMQRVYVSDPQIPFHKLVINSNASPALQSLPNFGIQAEVSFSAYKPEPVAGLTERVLSCIQNMGIVHASDQVVASNVTTLTRAYPIYTHDWVSVRQALLSYYQSHGVFCVGRFGEWSYINSDDAVLRGKEVAKTIDNLLE